MKQIIHKTIMKHYNTQDFFKHYIRKHYLCNQAIKPTKNKLSYQWKKVTCKNCLKQKDEE